MSRTTRTFATAAATLALGVTAALAGAGAASAASTTQTLDPGASVCVSQYAGYQVRGEGSATGGGARFKLLRAGSVIEATPGRVTAWVTERRTSYGTFPGAGSYAVCAHNTGTARTTVYLNILSDGQLP